MSYLQAFDSVIFGSTEIFAPGGCTANLRIIPVAGVVPEVETGVDPAAATVEGPVPANYTTRTSFGWNFTRLVFFSLLMPKQRPLSLTITPLTKNMAIRNKKLFTPAASSSTPVGFCNIRGLHSNLNAVHHLETAQPTLLFLTDTQISCPDIVHIVPAVS